MKYEAKWAVKEVGKDYSKYSAEFPGYFLQIFLTYPTPYVPATSPYVTIGIRGARAHSSS
jgi:hypothetical protein